MIRSNLYKLKFWKIKHGGGGLTQKRTHIWLFLIMYLIMPVLNTNLKMRVTKKVSPRTPTFLNPSLNVMSICEYFTYM